MKIVKRTNPRLDRLNKLRRKPPIPPSGHTPLTEAISETERQIRKEIAIMKKCRHPHVVKLLEVIDDKLKSKIYLSEHTLLTPFVVVLLYVIPETSHKPSTVYPPSDLAAPLWSNTKLTNLFPNSHGVSRRWRYSLERRGRSPHTALEPNEANIQGCHSWVRIP